MKANDFLTYFLPRIVRFQASRRRLVSPGLPVTLSYSVTNLCQSRCKTCRIWQRYRAHPAEAKNELQLDEIRRIFESIRGTIYFFNISGGEPTLRNDLPEIIRAACLTFRPRIIHTPTNAISPKRVERIVRESLEHMEQVGWHHPFTVKPSLDGIGADHDEIRGYPGNFERVLETVERLKRLKQRYPNLHVELGTVISRFNLDKVDEIAAFVQRLDVDNYRNEIAEERAEFNNWGDPITPTARQYADLMKRFKAKVAEDLKNKPKLTRVTQAFRFVYYDLVSRIMTERRQVIPCFAGVSNIHLSPEGDLWPCCVLGADYMLGSLREHDYDFRAVYYSPRARRIRRFIQQGGCHCPLANQAYGNILCHWPSLLKVLRHILS